MIIVGSPNISGSPSEHVIGLSLLSPHVTCSGSALCHLWEALRDSIEFATLSFHLH